MAKARVHFNTSLTQFLSEDVRDSFDIVSNPSAGQRTLTGVFKEASELVAAEAVKRIKKSASIKLGQAYLAALLDVEAQLKNGISKGYGPKFTSFSKLYKAKKIYRDKKRVGGVGNTANLFWIKEGGAKGHTDQMYPAFVGFRKTHSKEVQSASGKVTVRNAKRVYRGHRLRTNLTYNIPKPPIGGEFFKAIFHDAFFPTTRGSGLGTKAQAIAAFPGWSAWAKLASLEVGTDSRLDNKKNARPFIGRAMAKGGAKFDSDMLHILRAAERSVDLKDLVLIR